MPTLPQQPAARVQRSLQINITSEHDAKAVIQHLQAIKDNWDTLNDAGLVDSVEFCIAEPIRRKVDATLTGAIRWCRTYVKQVKPYEGNVFYALPHYVPGPVRPPQPPKAAAVLPAAPVLQLVTEAQEAPGKSKRLVRAEMTGA